MSIEVREVRDADLGAITAIYGHYVRTGLASFETEPPDETEIRARFENLQAKGFPYLVAQWDGRVAGFAYASRYRARPAYRFSLEDSVYVHPDFTGRGIGRALLARLIERCATIGCRQMVAIIGDSGNAASIGLHSALGFALVGTFRAIGFKHGRWVDSVLMQRAIGQGDSTLPGLP